MPISIYHDMGGDIVLGTIDEFTSNYSQELNASPEKGQGAHWLLKIYLVAGINGLRLEHELKVVVRCRRSRGGCITIED